MLFIHFESVRRLTVELHLSTHLVMKVTYIHLSALANWIMFTGITILHHYHVPRNNGLTKSVLKQAPHRSINRKFTL